MNSISDMTQCPTTLGAIIGGVAGGVLVIIVICCCCCRRRCFKSSLNPNQNIQYTNLTGINTSQYTGKNPINNSNKPYPTQVIQPGVNPLSVFNTTPSGSYSQGVYHTQAVPTVVYRNSTDNTQPAQPVFRNSTDYPQVLQPVVYDQNVENTTQATQTINYPMSEYVNQLKGVGYNTQADQPGVYPQYNTQADQYPQYTTRADQAGVYPQYNTQADQPGGYSKV
jgi:hypothetical protein